jgi:hypothetical protein
MTILFLLRGAFKGLMDLGDWSVEASIMRAYNRIGLKGGSRSAEEVLTTIKRQENNAPSS